LRSFASKGVLVHEPLHVLDFGEGESPAVFTGSECGLPHGFSFIRSALSREAQLRLTRRCINDWAFTSGWNNLVSNDASRRVTHDDLARLTWATLGYHYDWTNRTYVKGWKGEFPADLAAVCVELAAHVGVSQYAPTAAIVNYYAAGKRAPMLAHRDDAELTMRKPIVSISIGCSAVFCIETKPHDRTSHVVAVKVRSGDVCVMDGESRPALHAVVRVDAESPFASTSSSNDDVQSYLATHRINVNTRQVEGDDAAEQWS